MKNACSLRSLALLMALSFTALLTHATTLGSDDPGTGIKFFTGSWSDVLAEAKKQNKPVFVDIYTTWCGPCKQMAKQAFPDKAVGDLFNANFVSYQIDAEKGEGIEVAKKYAVKAYPTSLYVSASGDLIYRTVGYLGIKALLDEANKAVDAARDPKTIAVWDKEFADGKRDAGFLRAYLTKRAKLGMPNPEALEAYLNAAPEAELASPESLEALSGNLTTANSKAFDVLLQIGQANVRAQTAQMARTKQTAMQATGQALQRDEREAKTEAEVQTIINKRLKMNDMLSIYPVGGTSATIADGMWLSFYLRTKNIPKYREYAVKSASEIVNLSTDSLEARDEAGYQRFIARSATAPDSIKKSKSYARFAESIKHAETQQAAMHLNDLAWIYLKMMAEPADLKQALTWSGRSLELDRSAMYLDTYAQLLGKLGRRPEAIKHEEEALAKAKASGDDISDYEKTLADLKKPLADLKK